MEVLNLISNTLKTPCSRHCAIIMVKSSKFLVEKKDIFYGKTFVICYIKSTKIATHEHHIYMCNLALSQVKETKHSHLRNNLTKIQNHCPRCAGITYLCLFHFLGFHCLNSTAIVLNSESGATQSVRSLASQFVIWSCHFHFTQ